MKKMHSMLLASLLLVGMLAGCGSSGTETESALQDTLDTTAVPEETAAQTGPYVEKSDFGGQTFGKMAANSSTYMNNYFAEELTGDAMNDAVYNRTALTEEYLNVDLTHYMVTAGDEMGKFVLSGDTTYHLLLLHCMADVNKFAAEKYVLDWNTIPVIDLTREYYNQSCNEALSVQGKQYYAASDYMISDPICLLFNLELIEDLNMDKPYELVRDGKWTLDKMISMTSDATVDLNGDGKMDVNDQYGFGGLGDFHLISFMYAADCTLVDPDFQLIIYNENTISLVEKLDYLFNDSGNSFIWAWGDRDNTNKSIKMPTGRVLFQTEATSALLGYRECDVDYGILPYPKLTETQENYMSNNWGGLMAIPGSAADLEMIGSVLEMLAYFSGETTIPAYYDLQLGDKLSRDPESVEMLDIIFDSVVYDPGFNYFGREGKMNDLFYMVPRLVYQKKSADFTSWYEAAVSGAQAQIDTFLASFDS